MPLETGIICSLIFQAIDYEFQLITQIKMYLSLILSIKVYRGMVNTLTIKNNALYAIKKTNVCRRNKRDLGQAFSLVRKCVSMKLYKIF